MEQQMFLNGFDRPKRNHMHWDMGPVQQTTQTSQLQLLLSEPYLRQYDALL